MAATKGFFIFSLDLETGGLSSEKCQVVEVGIDVLDSNSLSSVDSFQSFVAPYGDLEIGKKALEISRISMSDIESGEKVEKVVSQMIDLAKRYKGNKYRGQMAAKDRPRILAHNTEFDVSFLNAMFAYCGKNLFDYFFTIPMDTMEFSRFLWGDEVKHGLSFACERAGISVSNHHRALDDAKMCSSLFRFYMSKMRGNEVTVENGGDSQKDFNKFIVKGKGFKF